MTGAAPGVCTTPIAPRSTSVRCGRELPPADEKLYAVERVALSPDDLSLVVVHINRVFAVTTRAAPPTVRCDRLDHEHQTSTRTPPGASAIAIQRRGERPLLLERQPETGAVFRRVDTERI
jgi:hypothetical protein